MSFSPNTAPPEKLVRYKKFLKVETHRLKLLHRAGADGQHVCQARAVGATPVLVTPLTRRQWDKEHPGKIKSSLAPYAVEVRKIAAEKNVPLVDLQASSIALCESLGPEKCLEFSPTKTNSDGTAGYDGTHLKGAGYVMFARLVLEDLRKAVPALSPALRVEPVNAQPVTKESKFDAVVSADGSGTHTTVQAAVDSAPANLTKPFVILVKPRGSQMVSARCSHSGSPWL